MFIKCVVKSFLVFQILLSNILELKVKGHRKSMYVQFRQIFDPTIHGMHFNQRLYIFKKSPSPPYQCMYFKEGLLELLKYFDKG